MSYKKWIHKYKFLQEDLIDTENQFNEYLETFTTDFDLDKGDKGDKSEDPNKLPDRIPDNLCKPIFKRLSKTLHPDKGGDQNDFIKISHFYRNQDIIGLYIMSEKYNIEIDDLLTDDIIPLFQTSCDNIEKKISGRTNSIAWVWATETGSFSRQRQIKDLEKRFNITPKKKN